jgi:hypothetical protein
MTLVSSRVPLPYSEPFLWFVIRHDMNPATKDLGLTSQTSGQEKGHVTVLRIGLQIRTTKVSSRSTLKADKST